MELEHIAPLTPQHDSLVKQKFATLSNWVHTMLNDGKFSAILQNGLWANAVNTTMLLKNIPLTPNRTLSP